MVRAVEQQCLAHGDATPCADYGPGEQHITLTLVYWRMWLIGKKNLTPQLKLGLLMENLWIQLREDRAIGFGCVFDDHNIDSFDDSSWIDGCITAQSTN